MVEWSITAVLKTAVPRGTGGSNPSLSAYFYGALVQLVRIHACHAWGHGFESRTHRISRSGAVVARQAHNLEVSGSIPGLGTSV